MTFDEWWEENAKKNGWTGSDDGSLQAEAAWDYQEERIDALEKVYKHARGLCAGEDWNNGTAAGHHREALKEAVAALLEGEKDGA